MIFSPNNPLDNPLYDYIHAFMLWFKGISPNEIRDTWSDDFFAVFNRENDRRIKENKEMEREQRKNNSSHTGSGEYLPEPEAPEDDPELVDFIEANMED